jgi:poly(hydroxyalkanoate) depolymerase family esterase
VIEGEYSERGTEPAAHEDSAPSPPAAEAPASAPFSMRGLLRRWKKPLDVPLEPQSPDAADRGPMVTGSYANADGERSYRLFVPTRYAGQALPLVVMLHGCKQTPDDFARGSRMNEFAEANDCFVLYPAQAGSANQACCWNWFEREHQQRDRGEPSILAGMTRSVIAQYSIDARKVYVAGLSAGGAMAAVMGTTYPELFAAIGIHSGLACGSAHDLPSALAAMKGMPAARAGAASGRAPEASRAIPTIVFHGDRDRTVHPRNGADVISQSRHHDGSDNTTATERGQAPGGHAYTRTVHRDATGRVVLEHWEVHGGGHAWFGGSRTGSYTDPRGPNAAQEMMRFFLQRT